VRPIRVSRQSEGPTQGMFDQMLLDRHKLSYGSPYVEVVLHQKLVLHRGRKHRAIADTIRYFDLKDAQAEKARKTALDVNRHERADEMKLRAMVGGIILKTSDGFVSQPATSDDEVSRAFRHEQQRHRIEGGRSSKSGKRHNSQKPCSSSTERSWYDT